MAQIIKVGAAQFPSDIGNVDANMGRHLDWIKRGRAADLGLLVLPELSLTGHHGGEMALSCAIKRDDPRLTALADATGDMAVVVSFTEEGPAAQFYNTSAILKNGQVLHMHRKINLPNYGALDEGKHVAAGRTVETCALAEDWRAGLLICADAWNPALTHLSFLHGATLLILPVSSGVEAVGADFDNPAGWALAVRFYAMMYGAPIIMANRVGTEKGLTFWGGSRVVDPFGRELAVAGNDEDLITAELDYDQVRKARYLLPTVRDSNIDLIHRETARLLQTRNTPELSPK
jgi:predicted amidohydrolase